MRLFKTSVILVVCFFTITSIALGQQGKKSPSKKSPMIQKNQVNPDSITDEELKTFAEGMQKAQQIRMQAQADVKKMVEDEGLSYKRFRQIMMSKQSKKMKGKVDMTDEEKKQMKNLRPKIQSANKDARKKMMNAIESTGMSRQRFQEIGKALRQNKGLVKRFKKIQRNMQKKKMKQMKDMKKKKSKDKNDDGSDK
jgi:hypothetical protein